MEAPGAKNEVKDVVRKLLSHDPVDFNSTINAHFASSCAYRGHGLSIHGAANLKHAAFLFNLADAGTAAKIQDSDIHWDETSSTARVKATRHLRPRLFPLFQFAVPTEVTLKFSPSSTDVDPRSEKNQLLYCTSFEDKWPLDSLIKSLPVVAFFYTHFFTPLATFFILQLSNFVFAVNARLGSWDRRVVKPTVKTYSDNVDPRLPKPLKDGFEQGKNLTEGVGNQAINLALTLTHGPLRGIEMAAQTSTSIANAILPPSLQLPYPSVFNDTDGQKLKTAKEGQLLFSGSDSSRRQSSSQMPEIRLSPSEEQPPSYHSVEPSQDKEQKSKASGESRDDKRSKNKEATPATASAEAEEKTTTDEAESARHAKVVIGNPSDQEGAKEIDVVTHEVTETGGDKKDDVASLYSQMKKDGGMQESLLAAEHAASGGDGHSETSAHSSPRLDQGGDDENDKGDASGSKKEGAGGSTNGGGSKKKKKSGKSSKSKK